MKKNIAVIDNYNNPVNYSFFDLTIKKIAFGDQETELTQKAIHDFLFTYWVQFAECDGILISSNINEEVAILMVLHIRLTPEWGLNDKPIVWNSKLGLEEIGAKSLKNNNSFVSNDHTKIISESDYNDLDKAIETHFKDYVLLKNESINQFSVFPLKGSHQITNEWAAYKLAYTAKLYDLLPEIEAQQEASKTLYFKYLKLKQKLKIEESSTEGVSVSSSLDHKYLLIDDNYAKGWELVFAEILKISNLGLDAFEEIKDINVDNEANIIVKIKKRITDEKYQGVLLDLRLNSFDDDESNVNTIITNFTGGRILEELKKEFPFLPIIMVTASNKAWNMRQLLDAGADGYFIKEDPESNPSPDISKSSYKAFKELIIASKAKYKALQPFWNHIKEIEDENLIEEPHNSKVEKRINERLQMFFGLLKRSFEDTSYNIRFHYSDKTLAFMTLWSCLNDIQFIYYDKSEQAWTTDTNNYYNIKIQHYLKSKHSLIVNTDYDYYLQKKNDSSNKFKSCLSYDYNLENSIYQLQLSPICKIGKNKINYSGSIGEQIAFLILTFSRSSKTVDNSLNQVNPTTLSDNLAKLKAKRNHIYLTHGNEDIGSGFFFKLEQDNTEISLKECAQMFEIVYFLLKGIYIKIDI